MRYWHGSPTVGLRVLEPRLDARTGIRGLFVTTDPDQAAMFCLLPNRAFSDINMYTTRVSTTAFIRSPHPLLDQGCVYEVSPGAAKPIERKKGRFYFESPLPVIRQAHWKAPDLVVVQRKEGEGYFAHLRIPV